MTNHPTDDGRWHLLDAYRIPRPDPERERRDQAIIGLRKLAQLLEDQPELPTPHSITAQAGPMTGTVQQRRAAVEDAAAALRLPIHRDDDQACSVTARLDHPSMDLYCAYVVYSSKAPAESSAARETRTSGEGAAPGVVTPAPSPHAADFRGWLTPTSPASTDPAQAAAEVPAELAPAEVRAGSTLYGGPVLPRPTRDRALALDPQTPLDELPAGYGESDEDAAALRACECEDCDATRAEADAEAEAAWRRGCGGGVA